MRSTTAGGSVDMDAVLPRPTVAPQPSGRTGAGSLRRSGKHWNDRGFVLPAEVVDQLGESGRVLLGEFSEAEVLAVGVRASIGAPTDEDTRTPLDRLGELEREREVAAAAAALVDRGVVEGSRRRQGRVHGALGLLQSAFASYRFLGVAFWLDPAQREPTPLMARMVDALGPDGRTLLLEQGLDPRTGRTQVLLTTPEAAVDALVAAAFDEHAGPRPVEGYRLSVLRLGSVWGTDTGRELVNTTVNRREGSAEAEVLVAVGEQPGPPGRGDRAAVHLVLSNIFRRALSAP